MSTLSLITELTGTEDKSNMIPSQTQQFAHSIESSKFFNLPKEPFWPPQQPHLHDPDKYKEPKPTTLTSTCPFLPEAGNIQSTSSCPLNPGLHLCFIKVTSKHTSYKHLSFCIYPKNMASSFKGKAEHHTFGTIQEASPSGMGDVMQWWHLAKQMRLCPGHVRTLTKTGHINHTWTKTLI